MTSLLNGNEDEAVGDSQMKTLRSSEKITTKKSEIEEEMMEALDETFLLELENDEFEHKEEDESLGLNA